MADIFKTLTENDKYYKYKEKYIKPLFFDSYVKKQQNLFGIYKIKIHVLNYLAKTKQIKGFEYCNDLLKSLSNIKSCKGY